MELSKEVIDLIDRSVLCWLATASTDLQPNVSPKEIFKMSGDNEIIIANIASPQSVKNIRANEKVCISLIDIFVQKGFQIKGSAKILGRDDEGFQECEEELLKLTEGMFPFSTITRIEIESVKRILAPRYILFPETTEKEQVESAKKSYGF